MVDGLALGRADGLALGRAEGFSLGKEEGFPSGLSIFIEGLALGRLSEKGEAKVIFVTGPRRSAVIRRQMENKKCIFLNIELPPFIS
jgi:hypothetical protein